MKGGSISSYGSSDGLHSLMNHSRSVAPATLRMSISKLKRNSLGKNGLQIGDWRFSIDMYVKLIEHEKIIA